MCNQSSVALPLAQRSPRLGNPLSRPAIPCWRWIRAALRACLCVGLLTPLAQASGWPQRDLEGQRRRFVAAEQAFRDGDQARYRQLKAGLKDYPLLPYLDHLELTKDRDLASPADLAAFIARFPDTPLTPGLRRQRLNRLAAAGDWPAFLDAYRPDDAIEQRCHYLTALWQTGRTDAAMAEVAPIWLTEDSQPEACNHLFEEWARLGNLTGDLLWQRIERAMERGNTALARDLGTRLPAPEQVWVQRWAEIRDNPRLLGEPNRLSGTHQERPRIVIDGIKRLAARDPVAASALWAGLRHDEGLAEADRCSGDVAVALAQARENAGAVLGDLDRFDACLDTSRLREQRLRAALHAGDWERLRRWIEALPAAEQADETWRYWRARALQAQGDEETATALWRDLAAERSYYGFLAADRLRSHYHFNHQPLRVDPGLAASIAEVPAAQRAKELLALGRAPPARREWHLLLEGLTAPELEAAASLAQDLGWHDQAILTLARAQSWDDLELRFPLAYSELIAAQADENRLDPAWIYALVRQESAFAPDIRSSAGAVGLTQLLPATASEMGQKRGAGRIAPLDLIRPSLNLALGSAYLATLSRRLGEHPVLATAAYNAGPSRVAGWLPAEPLDADRWVETIPLRETREYVQRVLAYLVIYRQRLGAEPLALSRLMTPISAERRPGGSERKSDHDKQPGR